MDLVRRIPSEDISVVQPALLRSMVAFVIMEDVYVTRNGISESSSLYQLSMIALRLYLFQPGDTDL